MLLSLMVHELLPLFHNRPTFCIKQSNKIYNKYTDHCRIGLANFIGPFQPKLSCNSMMIHILPFYLSCIIFLERLEKYWNYLMESGGGTPSCFFFFFFEEDLLCLKYEMTEDTLTFNFWRFRIEWKCDMV